MIAVAASTGDRLGTPSGACQGKMAAVRLTPPWQSQLFELSMSLTGVLAPNRLAASPTTGGNVGFFGSGAASKVRQGRSVCSGVSSKPAGT